MKKAFCIIRLVALTFIALSVVSPQTYALDTDKLEKLIADYTAKDPWNVGAVALVHTQGAERIITAGLADRDQNIAMQAYNRFHIASLSKMFTAVLTYQLIEEGKLSLDTKINTILDAQDYTNLDNFADTTIAMILEHSSGLPDFIGGDFNDKAIAARNHNWSAREALSFLGNSPASFKAGTGFEYSSTGYVLLGEIIKLIEQEDDLNKIYTRRIFEPCGLEHTYFPPPTRPRAPELARGYDMITTTSMSNLTDVSDIMWGERLADGGLVSTAQDLKKFLTALLIDKTLITDAHLAYMMDMDRQLPEISPGGRGLMLLNHYDHSGDYPLYYGHFGKYLGYSSAAFYAPDNGNMVIILANSPFFPLHKILQEVGVLAPLP